MKGGGIRIGQREKLSFNGLPTSWESYRARMALQCCPELEEMARLYSCTDQSLVGGSARKGPDFEWGGFAVEANLIGAGS